jgi:hypothetical protein
MKAYNNEGASYLILARKWRNGIIQFRRKRITGLLHCAYEIPTLDFNVQFELLMRINLEPVKLD